jgi:hypothetical protein
MPSPDVANVTTGPGLLRYAPLGTAEPATRVAAWPSGWVQVGYTSEGHTFNSSLSVDDVEVAELVDPVRRVTTKRDTKVAFAMAELTLAHFKLRLNGGTVVTDDAVLTDAAITNASPNLSSASAAWTADDVGKTVTHASIPPGTTILSRTSATVVVMSANATATAAGASVTVVGRWGSYIEPPAVGTETRIMLGWDSEDGLERAIWRRCMQTGGSETARKKGADYAKLAAEFSLEQPSAGLAPFRHFFATSRVAA